MLPDIDKEKKKNVRLALGIGAVCVFLFFALYILMFALIFFMPGFFLSLFPFPALSKDILSINDTLYVITSEADFSDMSFSAKTPPEQRFLLAVIDDNKNITDIREIKPFYSFTNDRKKIYFLSYGMYRTFDGAQRAEQKVKEIGKRPKAAASPEGVFVLSEGKTGQNLHLIQQDKVSEIPLPEEYAANKNSCVSSALLHMKNRLYLLWHSDGSMHLAFYDNRKWSAPESFAYYGRFKAVADEERIYLFHAKSENQFSLMLSTYEKGRWSEPKALEINSLFIDWSPVLHKSGLLIFARGLFSDDIYAIENSTAKNPAKLKSPVSGRNYLLRLALFMGMSFFVTLGFVYAVSAFMSRFKWKTWQSDSAEYEFASIFRRFLAKIIDSSILILPVLAVIAVFKEQIVSDPLRIFLVVILLIAYMILGSFLYHSLLEGIYGKTIGKKICGIKVLKDDFSKCRLSSAFLRNLMRIVDSWFSYLAALVSIAATLKWQRLGDIVSNTVVVREKEE